MVPTVAILNGPNLNLLGTREPEIYGRETLAEIEAACLRDAVQLGFGVDFRQTNSEGELVGWIQKLASGVAGMIVNAGGLSHTSVAVLDALRTVGEPVIEVHLSNIHRREPFRHRSYVSQVAHGVICGFGGHGYILALHAMANLLRNREQS